MNDVKAITYGIINNTPSIRELAKYAGMETEYNKTVMMDSRGRDRFYISLFRKLESMKGAD